MPSFLSCPPCPACAYIDTEHIPLEEDTIHSDRLLWICLDCGHVWRAPVQMLTEPLRPSVSDPRLVPSSS